MILVVTNKEDYTADFLILRLRERDIEYLRLNTEDFPQFVALSIRIGEAGFEGQLHCYGNNVDLKDIKSVWYRRPLPSIPSPQIVDDVAKDFVVIESRETLQGLWRILPCFWVSHPDRIRIAESKMQQLIIASQIGFTVPQTVITNSSNEATIFYAASGHNVIYKPQQFGRINRGDENNLIFTSVLNESHAGQFDAIQFSPVLLQNYVHKRLELRVTVVGEKVFAVKIYSQESDLAKYDWRRADPFQLRHVPCELPPRIRKMCIRLVKTLGLAFGAIDLILTPQNEYVFLEINPNGQWAWIEQLCPEVGIRDALIDLLSTSKNQP